MWLNLAKAICNEYACSCTSLMPITASGVHIGFFVCNVLPGVLGYQCFMAKCGRKRAINYDRKIIYI